MGLPPRSPLRPLRHPPIGLHPRISSSCDPPLWARPISSSLNLSILSRTLRHGIRRPQLCHWNGYAGVLLAGHV